MRGFCHSFPGLNKGVGLLLNSNSFRSYYRLQEITVYFAHFPPQRQIIS